LNIAFKNNTCNILPYILIEKKETVIIKKKT